MLALANCAGVEQPNKQGVGEEQGIYCIGRGGAKIYSEQVEIYTQLGILRRGARIDVLGRLDISGYNQDRSPTERASFDNPIKLEHAILKDGKVYRWVEGSNIGMIGDIGDSTDFDVNQIRRVLKSPKNCRSENIKKELLDLPKDIIFMPEEPAPQGSKT